MDGAAGERESQNLTDDAGSTLHVQALDAISNVNSFFSGAVFIGLSFNSDTASQLISSENCMAKVNVAKRLIVFEVVSFACYLLSSLIAQGLKLQLALIGARKDVQDANVPINVRVTQAGMLATAFSTVVGTVFLVLSIVHVLELRLGVLSCAESVWSKAAAIPLIVLGSTGALIFTVIAVFALMYTNGDSAS